MECNVGGLDRALRAALLGAAIGIGTRRGVHPVLRAVSAVAAAMAAFTVVTEYCPLNQLLGVNTCTNTAFRDGSKRRGEYLEERRPKDYAG